mgnify:CR=1 FL=1
MGTDRSKLKKKAYLMMLLAVILLPAMFFIPAGTIDYWQAWVFCGILLIPMLLIFSYFLKNDQKFLIHRLQFKEKEVKEKRLIKFTQPIFLLGLLLPGLDQRFHWSYVPLSVVVLADIVVFISYLFVFYVFRENSYASRIIEVQKGQKVISTGPYAVVRHPMYLGVFFMYLAMPLALGSYWAIIPFLTTPAVLIIRLLDEERLLLKDLPGYKKYCQKIRYRLLPFIW